MMTPDILRSGYAPAPMNAADAHLAKDPVMAGLIERFGGPLAPEADEPVVDLYGALLRSITGQQLSVKAAAAIYGRLIARFGDRAPTPEELLADDPEELRAAAGLSRAKTASLRSLAEHVIEGKLELDKLQALPDEEVIRELVAVKGIGEWTAHMYLMFTLHRPDLLPTGDQGIKNAIMTAYGLDAVPSPDAMTELAEPWRPHRTRACLYLWRSLDNEPI
jgi:DNA-3-methyladenine glycosylase II